MFTKNELLIISQLREVEGLTFRQLLETTQLARSSAHVALNQLQNAGIVVTKPWRTSAAVYALAAKNELELAAEHMLAEIREALFSQSSSQKLRLTFTDRYILPAAALDQLRHRYDVLTFAESPPFMTDEVFNARAKNAEIIVRFDAPTVDESFLADHPDLRVIVCPTNTVYNLDFEACSRHGIEVISLDPFEQRYSRDTQTEYVLNAILTMHNPIGESANVIRETGRYQPVKQSHQDVSGSRVGIVFANTDLRRHITVLRALDCQVSAASTLTNPPSAMSYDLTGYTPLEELWSWADTVVMLGGSTCNIDELLQRPRIPKYLVICTERVHYDPELVRQQILKGRLQGLVVDAMPDMFARRLFDEDVQTTMRAIVNLPNVYITPELSITSPAAEQRRDEFVLDILLNRRFA